jgi:hypothetical protein
MDIPHAMGNNPAPQEPLFSADDKMSEAVAAESPLTDIPSIPNRFGTITVPPTEAFWAATSGMTLPLLATTMFGGFATPKPFVEGQVKGGG